MIGRNISHYKILEKLGEGGMGVVYKAEDTKLRRSVALKFLRSDVLASAQHKERFLREAQAAAALDHPNICTVYEIDESGGQTFLAMAFVEGQSVKDKIAERPLKLEETLDIAIQTAQGLQVAHERGIVHRDIKPANLLINSQGQVKILDFGLALLGERSKLTETTAILGTPAYMSPEQARRQPTDRRTDLWSLGVVLYEMVTGRLPFDAERQEAVLYAIGNEQPEPVTALRAGLPLELEWIVGKALAKDPGERYQHVDEMVVDLRAVGKKRASAKVSSGSSVSADSAAAASVGPGSGEYKTPPSADLVSVEESRRRLRFHRALLALVVSGLLVLSFLYFGRTPPPAPLRKFAIQPSVRLGTELFGTNVAVSPNGRYIAFTPTGEDRTLWIEDLELGDPRSLPNTDGAIRPFWSPDSAFVGFVAHGELKKIPVAGGLPVTVCQMPSPRFFGGTWSPDGELIVFSSRSSRPDGGRGLFGVPASGGKLELVVSPDEIEGDLAGAALTAPTFLPTDGGRRVLIFTKGSQLGDESHTAMLQDLDSGRRLALRLGALPSYSPSGHVVFQESYNSHNLWALPFSLKDLEPSGEAFPIVQNGRGPTVAADGTLVYLDGYGSEERLVWFDRAGNRVESLGPQQESIAQLALSPDGQRVAITTQPENDNPDLWIENTVRGTRDPLTLDPSRDGWPVWSPTGDQIAFRSDRSGNGDIFVRRTDGSGEPEPLVATPQNELPLDWSRDGEYLLFEREDPATGSDLWSLQQNPDGSWTPKVFQQTPANETAASFSPDGRFVVYASDESGEWEVYIRPFPEGSSRSTVSSNGGWQPRWGKNGEELFYVRDGVLMALSVSTSSTFSLGSETRLFEHPRLSRGSRFARYDVSSNGERLILSEPVGLASEGTEPMIRVVQNWYEEFRDREAN